MIKYFAGVKGLIKNEKVNTSKCESIRNCFFPSFLSTNQTCTFPVDH